MICTKRDAAILEKLGKFGIMSTRQIAKAHFSNVETTTVRRRIRVLENAKLIHRISGLDQNESAWALTIKTARAIGCPYPLKHFNRNTVRHDVLLSEVRFSLESVGLGENWIPEYSLKAMTNGNPNTREREKQIIPDAIFSAKSKDKTYAIAVELELSGKSKKRYENIFTAYLKRKSLWGIWYLVKTETLGKTLESVWRKINGGKRNDSFMWTKLDDVLENPWEVKVQSDHFNYYLRDLVRMRPLKQKTAAPLGAPRQSSQTENKSDTTVDLAA